MTDSTIWQRLSGWLAALIPAVPPPYFRARTGEHQGRAWIILVYVILIYSSFYGLDVIVYPQHAVAFGLLRLAVVAIALFGLLAGRGRPRLRQVSAVLVFVAACLSISMMCALTEGFGSNYLVGIVLCYVGCTTLEIMSPLRYLQCAGASFVFHVAVNGICDRQVARGEIAWAVFMLGGAVFMCSIGALLFEVQRRRLFLATLQQGALLEAAARMAGGDLKSPIAVSPQSELAPLAGALDGMRQDLQTKIGLLDDMQVELRAKVTALESGNREIRLLNEELRRQIEQRSRRLLEMTLAQGGSALAGTPRLPPGAMLGECYRVLRTVGEGGMGVVYEVERTSDQRHFAAKVLSGRPDRTAAARFAREAQILARLNHPNLISITDIDQTGEGSLYIVMEYVAGSPLSQVTAQRGAREPRWGLQVLQQIAAAIAALHSQGIVHRDVKPDNVLLLGAGPDSPPLIKLADFGISLLLEDGHPTGQPSTQPGSALALADMNAVTIDSRPPGSPTTDPTLNAAVLPPSESAPASSESLRRAELLTRTGAILGTPLYMAPELASGSHLAQPAADMFGLGILAFELLTGELPFQSPAILAAMMRTVVHAPALATRRPDLSPAVAALIDECLQIDPARRPSAQQFVETLRRELSEIIVPAAPSPPTRSPT